MIEMIITEELCLYFFHGNFLDLQYLYASALDFEKQKVYDDNCAPLQRWLKPRLQSAHRCDGECDCLSLCHLMTTDCSCLSHELELGLAPLAHGSLKDEQVHLMDGCTKLLAPCRLDFLK